MGHKPGPKITKTGFVATTILNEELLWAGKSL
jgi:hypothetical protein